MIPCAKEILAATLLNKSGGIKDCDLLDPIQNGVGMYAEEQISIFY
jgi:hypothetical protein